MNLIPFNKPYMTGKEFDYMAEANFGGKLAGDGPFTKRCHEWLENTTGCAEALLTHSCTAALEMTAILLDIHPGDEIIMPSYTFVSTANAFVLRGGVPVFVDIRKDTLNLDENLIEAAITSKTKAIVPVHYAGVSCEMDTILEIAKRHKLKVVEDAAQGVMSKYKGKSLGSIGDLGAYSFHETKNIISGEGGALLVNDINFALRAEIIREKGTDRSKFFRGEVDKYTWQEVGSSYLPGEMTAAFLWAQMGEAKAITAKRLAAWEYYYKALIPLEKSGQIRLPVIPQECEHNAHMFYLLLDEKIDRTKLLGDMRGDGVSAVFHYVTLHDSPGGIKYGRSHGELEITKRLSERLIRLPLWADLNSELQSRVCESLERAIFNQ